MGPPWVPRQASQGPHALKPEPLPSAHSAVAMSLGSRPRMPLTTDRKHSEKKCHVADLSSVGGTMAPSEHEPTFFSCHRSLNKTV